MSIGVRFAHRLKRTRDKVQSTTTHPRGENPKPRRIVTLSVRFKFSILLEVEIPLRHDLLHWADRQWSRR